MPLHQSSVQEGHPGEDTIVIHTTADKLKEAEAQMLEIQNLNAVPESLGKYSMRACIFQFCQACVLYYFASQSSTKWYWYTSYPEPEDDALSRPPQGPDPQEIASFSILWYSPVFITMSGIEHFCCLYFRDTYLYYIARNQNPFRWTEYTFSASLIRVMIAQFAGITDVHLLLVTFILAAITMQCGASHEVFNAKARADGYEQNWRCFWLAWTSQLCSWVIIFNYFGMRVSGGSQPDFIWVIMIVMFLLDSSFGITFTLQWMKIPPFDGMYCTVLCFCVMFLFFIHWLISFVSSSLQITWRESVPLLCSVSLPKHCSLGLDLVGCTVDTKNISSRLVSCRIVSKPFKTILCVMIHTRTHTPLGGSVPFRPVQPVTHCNTLVRDIQRMNWHVATGKVNRCKYKNKCLYPNEFLQSVAILPVKQQQQYKKIESMRVLSG